MHNLKSNIAILIAAVSLLLSGVLFFIKPGEKKIAYIRSSDLVYGYLGMEDAHREYEEKSKIWQSNADTLQQEYKHSLDEYAVKKAKLSKEEKEQMEKSLQEQQQTLVNYMQTVKSQAKEEDEKITQEVLNQVNSFVEEYGKNNGYKIILGTTLSGSLLYGEDGMDITKEVLSALNKNYKGEGLSAK
jgi:outer membrane protein